MADYEIVRRTLNEGRAWELKQVICTRGGTSLFLGKYAEQAPVNYYGSFNDRELPYNCRIDMKDMLRDTAERVFSSGCQDADVIQEFDKAVTYRNTLLAKLFPRMTAAANAWNAILTAHDVKPEIQGQYEDAELWFVTTLDGHAVEFQVTAFNEDLRFTTTLEGLDSNIK